MVMPDVDGVTLQEIGRTLADFRNEVRGQLGQLVRADVYRAERIADQARIAAVEEQLKAERAAREKEAAARDAQRRNLTTALVVAVASAVLSPVFAVLIAR